LAPFVADVLALVPRKDQRAKGDCYLRLMLDGRRKTMQSMAERLPDGNEQNLRAEPPEGGEVRTDYWLSSQPAATALTELVRLGKIPGASSTTTANSSTASAWITR
jgi:glycerate kinase